MSTFEVKLARTASATQRKAITVEANDEEGARIAAEAAIEMDDNEGWTVDLDDPAGSGVQIRIERITLHAYDQEREAAV